MIDKTGIITLCNFIMNAAKEIYYLERMEIVQFHEEIGDKRGEELYSFLKAREIEKGIQKKVLLKIIGDSAFTIQKKVTRKLKK